MPWTYVSDSLGLTLRGGGKCHNCELCLQKPSQVVRHGGLRLLHQVLLRCQATIDHCTENKGNCVNDPTEIVASLRSALGRILPDSKVVYDCWTHMFGTRKEGKKQQKKNQEEEQSGECMFVVLVVLLPLAVCICCQFLRLLQFLWNGQIRVDFAALFEVQRSEHLLKILQNICLYQSVVPDFTSQRAMDLPSLLGVFCPQFCWSWTLLVEGAVCQNFPDFWPNLQKAFGRCASTTAVRQECWNFTWWSTCPRLT